MHVALVWKAKAGFNLKIPWHLTKFLTCWGLSKVHDNFLVSAPWERPVVGSPLLHSLWGIKNKLINTLTLSGKTAWLDPSLSWVQLGPAGPTHVGCFTRKSAHSMDQTQARSRLRLSHSYRLGLLVFNLHKYTLSRLQWWLSWHSIPQAYLGMLHVQNTFVVLSTHFITCQQVKGLIVWLRMCKLAQMLHRCCTVADD